MKILVLSLLRLGDLLMAAPALRSLRNEYPRAIIDVLINDSSAQAVGLLKDVDHFHILPRLQLQSSLVDAGAPLFQAPHDLLRIMTGLKSESYDLIVNFTHNRLSGYLAGFFDADKVLGLRLNAQDQPSFGSKWFQYLDRIAREPGRPVLHYTDVFSYALGVPSQGPYLNHSSQNQGKNSDGPHPLVVVQCLTSDEKKNWPMDKWDRCLTSFHQRVPQAHIVALASSAEAHILAPLQDSLHKKRIPFKVEVTNIREALAFLMSADLIVTLDTAIKHLSIDANAPLIEICLGSSDPYRTGAYRDNAYVLRPIHLECSPCAHSGGCSQSTRLCEASVEPEAVSEFMVDLVEGRPATHSTFASQNYELLKASRGDLGPWRMVLSGSAPTLPWLKADLEVVSAFAELRGLGEGLIRGEGTLAYQWLICLRRSFPNFSTTHWRHLFGELQHDQDGLAREVADARLRFDRYLKEESGSDLVQLEPLQAMRHKLARLGQMNETKSKILQAADRLIAEVRL